MISKYNLVIFVAREFKFDKFKLGGLMLEAHCSNMELGELSQH
jgi:hypothetical protein